MSPKEVYLPDSAEALEQQRLEKEAAANAKKQQEEFFAKPLDGEDVPEGLKGKTVKDVLEGFQAKETEVADMKKPLPSQLI